MWKLAIGFGLLCAAASSVAQSATTVGAEHAVFVAATDDHRVFGIDPDLLDIVTSFDLGIAPTQIVVSSKARTLLAIDGIHASIAAYDLAAGKPRAIELSFAPQRLIIAPDEWRAAAIDQETGQVALLDLTGNTEVAEVMLAAKVTAAVFERDGQGIVAAAADRLLFVDFSARATRTLGIPLGSPITALIRAPNGRDLYSLDANGAVARLDAARSDALTADPIRGAQGLTASGTGRFLFASERNGNLAVLRTHPLAIEKRLDGASAASGIYAAWFDTVAFVPDAGRRLLLAYDLDRVAPLAPIELPGTPAAAAVTPAGDKLFVAIPETAKLVVVDAASRRVVSLIALPIAPSLVTIAGSYGLCH